MKIKTETKQILAGTFLVVLLAVSLLFVHSRGKTDNHNEGFVLYAPFTKADGLMTGADVRIAGIKVGQVVNQELSEGYRVKVKLRFNHPVYISDDSSAIIETDGLLGSKYLEIIPGGSEDMLLNGSEILYTQDALILTELMDKVNAYMREKKKDELSSDEGDVE